MTKFIRRSILVKLLLILAVAGVLINLVVFWGLRYFFSNPRLRPDVHASVERLAGYLRKDIGDPPNLARAKELADEMSLSMRLDGERVHWASAPTVPALSDLLPSARRTYDDGFLYGRFDRAHFIIMETYASGRPAKFTLFLASGPHFEPRPIRFIGLLLVLSFILGLSFFVIRRVLRPLVPLTEGVKAIGAGKFGYQVPASEPDELGNLARAFNEMSARLKEMVTAKEQLLVDVSHELRSPITRAKLALEFVRTDESAWTEMQRDLDEMDHMVKELLESGRLDSGHGGLAITELDLAALIREVTRDFLDRAVQIDLSRLPPHLKALADYDRIKAVVRNVLENSLKYSPADKPISVRVIPSSEVITIEISDEGPGIPAAELERVFEPFYRIDKSRTRKTGGFGLGLALCRKIMRAHRGEIVLRSTGNHGTTAVITLPIIDQ